MIINSESAHLIRQNATRLAKAVRSKDDLVELATAGSFEQVFAAIEALLTNTDMYFDDELLSLLEDETWKSFKATLLVYTLNLVNKFHATSGGQSSYNPVGINMNMHEGQNHDHQHHDRGFEGASSHP
jgi:hypothetical protein